jgi:hypothetical protein
MATSVQARIASNWIELIAVPVATALMETQPIRLGLQLLASHFFMAADNIDAGSIVFLLLFFNWWALWGRARRAQRGALANATTRISITFHDIPGMVLALLVFGLTHFSALGDGLTPVLASIVIGWSWLRGVQRAQTGPAENQLILWFKIGFGVLLVVICFALLDGFTQPDILANELLSNLPIFFLAGFLALSLTRIAAIKKEQESQQQMAHQAGTNTWAMALTATWILLVVVSIATELLPVTALIAILSPLWWLIGLLLQIIFTLLSWIIYGVFILYALILGLVMHLFPAAQALKKPSTPLPKMSPLRAPVAAQHSPILQIIALACVIIAIFGIAWFIKSRQKDPLEETLPTEEEIREGLDALQIRRDRRLERKKLQQAEQLDILASDSARIHYRAFLQTMAEKGAPSERRNNETPAEYQQRLLAMTETTFPPQTADIPSERAILATLTDAYVQERYGGKNLAGEQKQYLNQWLPHLRQRLNEHLSTTPKTQKQPYQPSRWGED